MRKLGVVDNGFLIAETRDTPLHVAVLQIFKLPKGVDKQAFYAEIIETMGRVTATTELFNQRLNNSPLSAVSPSWVADDDFDIDYHIRHSALPLPGTMDQLLTLVARLHGVLLDRTRPLWEMHVIEGIENNQFALYFKIHHAVIDGVGGMRLMQAMLSKSAGAHTAHPLGEREAKKRKPKRPELTAQQQLLDTVEQIRTLVPEMGKELFALGRQRFIPDAEAARQWYQAPDSAINIPVTAQRRFAVNSFKLADFKRVGKAKKVTVNDVVLTICGGAIRRYLLEEGSLPEKSLNAGVPVSIRAKDGNSGNAFSMLVCDMGTHIEDSEERLRFVHNSTTSAKAQLGRLSKESITGLNVLMGAPFMAAQMLKMAKNIPLAYNAIVSNVPGSKDKLYLNGAELVDFYAISLLYDMVALNIVITSYVDSLDFGLVSCRSAIPKLDKLAAYLTSEFNKLEETI